MESLTQAFLEGKQRVTAKILYYVPRPDGAPALRLSSQFLGEKPRLISHTGVLQSFVYQVDDKSDLEDERLQRVFAELVTKNGGIVALHDRRLRMQIMDEFAASGRPVAVAPVIIPTIEQEQSPGMADEVLAFKTLIPFLAVRKFLKFWQEKIDGPLKEVQIASAPLSSTSYSQATHYTMH